MAPAGWALACAALGSLALAGCAGSIGDGEPYDNSEPFPGADTAASASDGDSTSDGASTASDEGSGGLSTDEAESQPDEPAAGDPGAGAEPAAADGAAAAADADSAAAAAPKTGVELYTAYCSACHGEAGVGTLIGPEVQHPKADFATWVVRNGFEGAYDAPMLALSSDLLGDEDLALVIDYLNALPQPTTDEGLYLDYCGNCHGEDARGGPSSKNIAGKDEFAEVLRQGKGSDSFSARTRYMPKWSSGELESGIVSSLEDFVGSLPE